MKAQISYNVSDLRHETELHAYFSGGYQSPCRLMLCSYSYHMSYGMTLHVHIESLKTLCLNHTTYTFVVSFDSFEGYGVINVYSPCGLAVW